MKIITKLSAVLIGLLFATPALAQQDQGALNALVTYASLSSMVIATGLVVGFATVISGILYFKNSAHDRLTYPIGGGVSRLLTGVAMLSFTGVYVVLKTSFLTGGDDSWVMESGSSILSLSTSIQENGLGDKTIASSILTEEMKAIAKGILFLVGLIFFFVGIHKFKDTGSNNSKGTASMKDAILTMFGGVALMNAGMTACLILSFGPSAFMCSS